MRLKYIITIVCLAILSVLFYFNWKYEMIAFNPFMSEGISELRVMTWNVHCSDGAEPVRQRMIAELIYKENSDFVFLNEYNQDSCKVLDSLLKIKYLFTEELRSHRHCGDIFYSKKDLYNSGRVFTREQRRYIQTIKATIAMGVDSIQIFGVHMVSNHYDNNDKGIASYPSMEHESAYERYKRAKAFRSNQAKWIKEEILKSNNPVIVLGDMNDFCCTAPLDIFQTSGLKNAWWEGGNGYGATYHDGWMRLRIDHILHSDKLKLQSIKVIDTNLSDHNPIVAGFNVNN